MYDLTNGTDTLLFNSTLANDVAVDPINGYVQNHLYNTPLQIIVLFFFLHPLDLSTGHHRHRGELKGGH